MVMVISFVDCYFVFRFCFGHIVKDACHFLYCRNNEHMILKKKKEKKKKEKRSQ